MALLLLVAGNLSSLCPACIGVRDEVAVALSVLLVAIVVLLVFSLCHGDFLPTCGVRQTSWFAGVSAALVRDAVPVGAGGQGQPVAGARRRVEGSVLRDRHSLDEFRFEVGVVSEVLDVAQVRHRGGDRGVEGGSAVGGDVEVVGCGECGAAQEAGVAAAPLSVSESVNLRGELEVVG